MDEDARHAKPDADKPDADTSPQERLRRGIAYAIAVLVLVTCTAVGSVLVEFPLSWPQTFWGVVLLLFGAALLVFAALVTPFLSDLAHRIEGLPAALRRRAGLFKTQPGRLATAVVAILVVAAAAFYVRPPASPLDLEPGKLTLLSGFDESPSDPRKILVDQWNQTHPNNQVTIEYAPGEPDQQHDRMVNDASEKGAHQADVYALDIVWMAEFIKQGYIRSLAESSPSSKPDDFLPNVLDTCHDLSGDKAGLWGLPLNTDAGLLFYRAGLGKPASWDDYLGSSAKDALNRARNDPAVTDGAKLAAASAAQFADEEILTVTALEAIWAAGGEVVNPDGKLVLNEDSTAVEFDGRARVALHDLAAAYADREISLPDAAQADEDAAVTAFDDGRTLFMRNWPVTYDKLLNASRKNAPAFEVAALPGPSVLGGQNLAISRWSKRPRAAQAFMEFLSSPSSQLILFEVGGFAPTRNGVYADLSPMSRPYAQDLRTAVERARRRPVTPKYIAFSAEFRKGVLRALRNGGDFEPDFPQRLATSLQE